MFLVDPILIHVPILDLQIIHLTLITIYVFY